MTATLLDDATALSGTYGLLARIWFRELDRGILEALFSPPLRDAFRGAGGVLPANQDDHTIEELAIDYCRLFVGPSQHLPPYQSVWQSGQFQAATAASMNTFVEIVDYDADQLPTGTMLDHFGVQLDVMGHILNRASTAQSEREELSEIAQSYFRTHLSWSDELLDAAERRAATDFYRAAIKLTRNFLKGNKTA